MESMEEVRFRSLPSSLSLLFPSLRLDVLWSRKRMEVKAVILDHIHKEPRYTHNEKSTEGMKKNNTKKKKQKRTQLWPRSPWYMYCVVSVYDKRVKNYYQSMIWIMFAPLTILLLNFFRPISLYFIYLFRFVWMIELFFFSSVSCVWHASIH